MLSTGGGGLEGRGGGGLFGRGGGGLAGGEGGGVLVGRGGGGLDDKYKYKYVVTTLGFRSLSSFGF